MVDQIQQRQSIQVVNPATGEVFSECPLTTEQALETVIQRADDARKSWAQDESCRRDALRQCAQLISSRRHSMELARLLTQEQGKPFKEALQEVYGTAHWFAATAEIKLELAADEAEKPGLHFRHQPLGIVGAITPWNFPLLLAAAKVAPALLAGNTVILKPSPFTPLTTQRLVELVTTTQLKDHAAAPLPNNVLQVVQGGGDVGRWMISHPAIQKISFTGSTATGQAIAATAATSLKRVTLELGGNDAAIVLADADVDAIADKIFWGAFTNAGQFCVGIKRLYVHESLCSTMVTRLVSICESIRQGDGSIGGTQMGPIATEAQLQRVRDLVTAAVQAGGRVHSGGQSCDSRGYFFPPSIVTDVTDDQPIVAEEQFGPVLPVLSFGDEAEAVTRANATHFGLGGSIWTNDLDRGRALADQLECGTCWVNQHGVLDPLIPFGGHKQSGIGYENGLAGVREFLKLKVVNVLLNSR